MCVMSHSTGTAFFFLLFIYGNGGVNLELQYVHAYMDIKAKGHHVCLIQLGFKT
jgi:hypothetical protein